MPKYLDPNGVSLLWSQIKHIQSRNLIYQAKTTEQWRVEPEYISEQNVLYIFTDYKTIIKDQEEIVIPGLKIGDGKSYVIDLPFFNNPEFEQLLLNHINDTTIHITPQQRWFWNNKINIDVEVENLIFNRS